MNNEPETVPCRLCGEPTYMKNTKLCDRCYELVTRIHGDPEMARRILAEKGWRQPRYSYAAYNFDRFFGKRLFHVQRCYGDRFRVKEAVLVKNEKGVLGWIGDGIVWALNYIVGEGSWAFNPTKPGRLEWSPYHHAFIFKMDAEHFEYPVIINEFYTLSDGKKEALREYSKMEIPKLPRRKVM